jgi:hypothetical protein
MKGDVLSPSRKYLAVSFFTTCLLGIPFILNYIFLCQAYEVQSYSEIIGKLNLTNGIYGSGVNGNDHKYKATLLRSRQPDVVVIGSSRVMQMRSNPFSGVFVNCGGVFGSIGEGQAFIEEVLRLVKLPKVVLLGVDYWWFNKRYIPVRPESARFEDETRVTYQKLVQPFLWLWEEKLTWKRYFSILRGAQVENDYSRLPLYGMQAIQFSSGWRSDGSYLNAKSAFHLGTESGGVLDDIREINGGYSVRTNLGYGDFIDETLFSRFRASIQELQAKGIKVVLFLPPIAPAHLKAIENARSPFMKDISGRLNHLGDEFYDFTDIRTIHDDNCEFLDGWHPGETMNLRLLKQIALVNPVSAVTSFLDIDAIKYAILHSQGRNIVSFENEYFYFKKEEICYRWN